MFDLWPRNGDGNYETFPVVSIVKGMSFILIHDWSPSFVAPYYFVIVSECDGKPIQIRSRMIEPIIGEDPGQYISESRFLRVATLIPEFTRYWQVFSILLS